MERQIPVLFDSKEDCCGCGACENICPKNAVTMEEDEYGYLFPQINSALCIRCNSCVRVCGYKKDNQGLVPIRSYGVINTSKETIMNSASGGAFSALAEEVLDDGGVVFGCCSNYVDGKIHPEHIMITQSQELPLLQGSKYVQSRIGLIYRKVKESLKSGKTVLFSGTPCQIDALYSFLGSRDSEKLYTVDIICHGVPNARLFQDYIQQVEEKHKISVEQFYARDKSKGWGSFEYAIDYRDTSGTAGRISKFARCSSYYWLFLNGVIYRENCYSCKYACSKRISDITIGDYWGIMQEHPEVNSDRHFHPQNGVSCVMINTERGAELFEKAKNRFKTVESEFNKIQRHNDQLRRPAVKHSGREEVLELYRKSGYHAVEKWYRKHIGMKYIIYTLWNKFPVGARKLLKKFQ